MTNRHSITEGIMSTLIHVTADDIENGRAGSCGRCPVALALRRTISCETCDVAVSSFTTHIYLPWGAVGLPHSRPLADFIVNFDNGGVGSPFSFRMDLPE